MTDEEKAAAKAKAEADAKAKADADAAAKKQADEEKAAAKAKAARKPFHVPGPGSVFFNGKLYKAGAELSLTEDEAAEMVDVIKPGRKPAEPAAIGERVAGKYRVTGLGNVCSEGTFHGKGKVLMLDEEDARRLGPYVEEV